MVRFAVQCGFFRKKIAECILALQVEGLKIFAEITIRLSGMCYFTENCSKFFLNLNVS